MITIEKKPDPNGYWIQINGTIEENVDLSEMVGTFSGVLRVNCKNILRINSVGVKSWMIYFQKLKLSCKFFQFEECSPAIVDQLNMISNFTCGGEVVSVLLPYACTSCNKEFVMPVNVQTILDNGLRAPKAVCEKPVCGAVFDDNEAAYFNFLEP